MGLFSKKADQAPDPASAQPDWDAVRPGDYIECAGNVGRVEVYPDGSKSFTIYPAELTRHIERPNGQPVEQRATRYFGTVWLNTYWTGTTTAVGTTYTIPTLGA